MGAAPENLRFRAPQGFPGGSAFFEGHFPDNPVVPGAVILGYLAARLEVEGLHLAGVSRMKFLRPLRADTPFEARVQPKGTGARVEFFDRDGVFAAGQVHIGPTA